MIDLEQVEEYVKEINYLKGIIEKMEESIVVLKNVYCIDVKGKRSDRSDTVLSIEDNTYGLRLNSNSIEVFKSVAIKELEDSIAEYGAELEEVIKNGLQEKEEVVG